MKMGKHVYCQKPLTQTVYEARYLRKLAKDYGVVTQMGNQGSSEEGLRRAIEVVQAGVIGPVKQIHVWTNRPIWPQGITRPAGEDPVPANLKWDPAAFEQPNLVFAGTSVSTGNGRAVVTATGMDTQFGRIAHLTQSVAEEPSPLQREVSRLTRVVTLLAVGIGVAFFALSVGVVGRSLAAGFLFAVGMVVAFVPEGLLPTVTLALAMGVQRMARRNALVKRLSAVETLGACTVICTDKTGTLTQNEMTVREAWTPDARFSATGVGYAPACAFRLPGGGAPAAGGTEEAALREVLAAAALCNNARLLPPAGGGGWSILGDPTEAALLVAAAKAGLDEEALRRAAPRRREIPFDSRRRRMTTVHGHTIVNGAPHPLIAAFGLDRFQTGALIDEGAASGVAH